MYEKVLETIVPKVIKQKTSLQGKLVGEEKWVAL